MKWIRYLQRRCLDEDLARELESYLEHEADTQTVGSDASTTRAAAQRKLGNPTLIREEVYLMNTIGWLDVLTHDLCYALRGLRNSPGFTAVAMLSLVLGIGLNTGMFSVINAVLLRALPYPNAQQIVSLGHESGRGAVTIPEYEFWKRQSNAFASVAGYRGGGDQRLSIGDGSMQWIQTLTVTTDFFRTLGLPFAFGREFTASETTAGGPSAIILTNTLWRQQFGADTQILGRRISLDDKSYTVVGVLPQRFWFPQQAQAYLPLRPTGNLSDSGTNTSLIARLKAGLTITQGRAEVALTIENYLREQSSTSAASRRAYRDFSILSFQQSLLGDARLNLLLLFGATGLLLVIACSNLATLLLTRSISRLKELAIRLALGSSKSRLALQFFIESLLISTFGAAAGLFAAWLLVKALLAWMPFDLPGADPVRLDFTVLLFTCAVAFLTALAFTFVPIAAATRLNVQETLKSAAGRSARGSVPTLLRSVLVIGQIALSTVLLIAAGLLIQSLHHLYEQRLGFVPQSVMSFETPFAPERRHNADDRMNFTRTLLSRLNGMPGVRSVAATNVLPLVGWANVPAQHQGHPEQSIGGMEIRPVTPQYFELMGIPVRRGRSFTPIDGANSLPIAVINETLAQRWWRDGSAMGDRVVVGRFRDHQYLNDVPREVIGVVADSKTMLKEPARPTIFIPLSQAAALQPGSLSWIVKTSRAIPIANEIRRAILSLDATQRVERMRTLDEVVRATTAESRFNVSLFGILAGVALSLAAVGVYGLLSFLVAQRRQEIGTRMALGATGRNILSLFLKQGITLALTGLAIGMLGSYFLTHWLASLLYQVQSRDALTFAAASTVLVLAALVAIYLPARRASKIDPMRALRYD